MSKKTPKAEEKVNFSKFIEVYGFFAAVGFILSLYAHNNFFKAFELPSIKEDWEFLSMVIIAGTGAVLSLHELYRSLFREQYAQLRKWTLSLVGDLSFLKIVFLILMSSCSEEIFFRVALQPSLGVLGGSLLFTLLHLVPQVMLLPFCSTIFMSNVIIGTIFEHTQSIYPGIFINIVLNSRLLFELSTSTKSPKEAQNKKENETNA